MGAFGCVALCVNGIFKEKIIKNNYLERFITICFGIIFTTMVILSNYFLFENLLYYEEASSYFNRLYKVFLFSQVSAGWFLIFYHILQLLYICLNNYVSKMYAKGKAERVGSVFAVAFFVKFSTCVIIMCCCRFPGIFNSDSVYQMQQALSGMYTNHHPFYHTMLIKFFLMFGISAFDDIVIGVALYSLFQICSMALIFASAVVTIYQIRVSSWWVWALWGCYTFLPIHITYSYAMWKDVLFGGAVLLFCVGLFRILYNVGTNLWLNYIILAIGGMGACLWRSNGFFAVVIATISFSLLLGKTQSRIFVFLSLILLTSYIMKHPMLEMFHIKQPDTVEMLSIPIQQMAEMIVNEGENLTDEERDLLENLVSIEEINTVYEPGYSDPMKNALRKEKRQEYLIEHMDEYSKLYFELGLKHPKQYLFGWIKQTKGYWNGGYKEFIDWRRRGSENEWGLQVQSPVIGVNEMWEEYAWCFEVIPALRILLCIGVQVWALVMLLFLALMCGNKKICVVIILPLAVVASLLVSTPVDAMYRYAYAVFCCVPFLSCCIPVYKMK